MAISPAYSPLDPAFGWTDTAAYPVMAASHRSSWLIISRYPAVWSLGAKGWIVEKPGQVMGAISTAALSYMVHDPKGIIVRSRARSLSTSRRKYLMSSVSEWYRWNVECDR
jgi:hypothetical protein